MFCLCSPRRERAIQPLAFWLKPISIFGLFSVTEFINSSFVLALPLSLAPFRIMLADSLCPHRFSLTPFEDGLHCPASFIPSRCQDRM
ncbi:hypothetical protein BN874_1690003 [Candidatus Contendobacter odensis Run_B_J11]|uniref:Uncharacterized protein n=1 Tax=Candidatus Contendobacter odensis Run_B_J11 TaxID=1400861 RepID=A0A7U7J3R8_9GAMM|nr:hypothetical protein BN874_1690003 [Candidatus Contendobacter odensis Run_B_J11]